ncbi:hypothetical protein [Pollutibacter soli]|uniref:hypothetical protein n=1 Tax=Pollutibacter soli TaxID=3034157 RepID=UPI00301338A1
MKGFLAVLILSWSLVGACRKTNQFSAKQIGLAGTWKMKEINSNEYWGGPLSWKTIDEDVVVRFTEEGNYYRKPAGQPNYILEGKYEILADNQLKIIASDPPNTQTIDYTIEYYFEGNTLILGTGRTETVVQEKFVRL